MGRVSQAGFNFLVASEGFKTTAYRLRYKNKAGKLIVEDFCTVGIGHADQSKKLNLVEGKDYGVAFCIKLFQEDAAGSIGQAVNEVWDGSGMNQCQYDAMLSFAWNCGGGGFKSALAPYIKKWRNKQITDAQLASIWHQAKCTAKSHPARR